MKNIYSKLFITLAISAISNCLYAQYPAGSPVAINGKLKVVGTKLTNECGTAIQLRGMSTHGLQWFEGCVTGSSLDALVRDWKGDIFRLAMYIQENGYQTNPTKWKAYIDNMVDECARRGIYCLIDWHVMTPGDPNASIADAREFWTYMSNKHKGKKHVLYEICNEPNGVNWTQVKTFANDIIPRIRANDPSTIVIVGTPTYSQDVDIASTDKLNYTNLMYALHFYAATHGASYREKANTAIRNGLALFVTEFGTSEASGTASINLTETESWMTWMNQNQISWCNWSYSDKDEAAASLTPGSCAAGTWNSTTPSGTYVKGKMTGTDNFPACSAAVNVPPPVVELTAPLNNASFVRPADITFTATATATSGTVTKVDFYQGSTLLGTDNAAPYTYTWANAPVGTYIVKAIATTSAGIIGLSAGRNIYVNIPQTPYKGTAWPIPGKVEAEDYDIGGNNNAYFDSNTGNSGNQYRTDDVDVETAAGASGGYALGYIIAGEWLEYSVNVAANAEHSFGIAVACNATGKRMHIEMNGVNVTGPMAVPNTGGWTSWQTITVPNKLLSSGPQVMRVVFDTDGINYDYVEVRQTGLPTGVNDVEASMVNIYPNPSNTSFIISLPQNVTRVSVIDVYGREVEARENLEGSKQIIIGTNLLDGAYTLQLQKASGSVETHKLVKVK